MRHIDECRLCQKERPLHKSHIVPKFVVEWLKRTSATGYLRQASSVNQRRQDIARVRLLCADCEVLLSKVEQHFAAKVFIPFHEKGQDGFLYTEWFQRFGVSLAWRVAAVELDFLRRSHPDHAVIVERGMGHWRDYLLGASPSPGPSTHHFAFFDAIAAADGIDVPPKAHWYFFRGIDAAVPTRGDEVSVYTKLPGMFFWSPLEPADPPGWHGTRILPRGTCMPPVRMGQIGFGEFLLERAAVVSIVQDELSPRQVAAIASRSSGRPITSHVDRAQRLDSLWGIAQK